MRWFRRLLLLCSILSLGAAAAVAWRLSAVPPEVLVADARARLEAAGISVEVDGEPEFAVWPWPQVHVGAVRGNIPAGSGRAAVRLTASRARLGLSVGDLARGRLVLGRVDLDGARLELNDERLPEPLALTDARLVLSPGPGGSLSLAGDGAFAGRRITVAARIADTAALAGGGPSGVVLHLSSEDDEVSLDGDLRLRPDLPLPAFSGTVAAAVAEPAALARWLAGTGAPPWLAGLRAVDAEATVDATPDRFLLRGRGTAEAGGRVVGVDATIRALAGWMRTGNGSAEVTARSGGLFTVTWKAPFGPDGSGAWRASGPVKVAILDLGAVRAWSALDLPGLPADGAARLTGEMTAGPGTVAITGIELRREGAEPLVGAIEFAPGTGEVRGGVGREAPAAPPVTAEPPAPVTVAAPGVPAGAAAPIAPPPADLAGDPVATSSPPARSGAGADGVAVRSAERESAGAASVPRTPGRSRNAADGREGQGAFDPPPSATARPAGPPDVAATVDRADDRRDASLPPDAPARQPSRPDPSTAPVPAPRTPASALAPAAGDP